MRLTIILILSFIASSLMGQDTLKKLTITSLTGNFYLYTTYGDAGNGVLFPANGMYLVTNKGVVLFDTPWDTTQFQPLLDSIQVNHNQKVVMCLATHFHDDRTAGLTYYASKGIKTFTTKLTDKLAKEHKLPRASDIIKAEELYQTGDYTFEIYYPGKGHSPDNIVIWFPNERILYGGCFIKSVEATSLGNLSDANPKAWKHSIKKVQSRFKKPKFIIPGHQSWVDNNSLNHTLELVSQYKKEKSK